MGVRELEKDEIYKNRLQTHFLCSYFYDPMKFTSRLKNAKVLIIISLLFWGGGFIPSCTAGTTSTKEVWSENVRLTYEAFNPLYGSDIGVSGNNIYVVWSDGRFFSLATGFPDYEIFFKRSNDGGRSWSEDIRLTNTTGYYAEVGKMYHDMSPRMAIAEDTIHIVWNRKMGQDEHGFDIADVFYKKSEDSGVTWVNETRLTFAQKFSGDPNIVIDEK